MQPILAQCNSSAYGNNFRTGYKSGEHSGSNTEHLAEHKSVVKYRFRVYLARSVLYYRFKLCLMLSVATQVFTRFILHSKIDSSSLGMLKDNAENR